jgi:hypothetical protein
LVRPPNLAQNQPRFTIAAEVVAVDDRFDVLEAVVAKLAICGTAALATAKRTTADPLRS